jgi:hypothetical protein
VEVGECSSYGRTGGPIFILPGWMDGWMGRWTSFRSGDRLVGGLFAFLVLWGLLSLLV